MMGHKLVLVAQRQLLSFVMLRLKRKPISLMLIQKQVVFTVVVDQAPQGRQIQNIRVAVWSKSN